MEGFVCFFSWGRYKAFFIYPQSSSGGKRTIDLAFSLFFPECPDNTLHQYILLGDSVITVLAEAIYSSKEEEGE